MFDLKIVRDLIQLSLKALLITFLQYTPSLKKCINLHYDIENLFQTFNQENQQ